MRPTVMEINLEAFKYNIKPIAKMKSKVRKFNI